MFNVGCLEPPIDYAPENSPWFLRATVAKRVHGKLRTSVHFITEQEDEAGEKHATTRHLDSLAIDVAKDRQKFAKACIEEGATIPHEDIEKALVELLLLIEVQVRQQEAYVPTTKETASPYYEKEGGLFWRKPTQDGIEDVQLTNFTAHILSDLAVDDGVEVARTYTIEATLNGRLSTFAVEAEEFRHMAWVDRHLGAQAVIEPGRTMMDRAQTAIRKVSPDIAIRTAYGHLGWRKHGDHGMFLHAGGALCPECPVAEIEMILPEKLHRYVLPPLPLDPADIRTALQASLRVLDLAPRDVILPLYASIWVAILGQGALTTFTVGKTGEHKSSLQALMLCHFGKDFTDETFPENWESSANDLEKMLFLAKDVVLVIDEFTPNSQAQAQTLHRTADRVIRAQANRSARGRMRVDTSLRPGKPPRGMLLANGEDVPRGHSLRSRMIVNEVPKGSITKDKDRLTACQADARAGLYTQALAAFIAWLAPRYGEVQATIADEVTQLCQYALQSALHFGHPRTAKNIARLGIGWKYFLAFARDAGIFTEAEQLRQWTEGWDILLQVGAAQHELQAQADQARRFIELLKDAIASGQAHLIRRDGTAPATPRLWGWRRGDDDAEKPDNLVTAWTPCGPTIGYVDDDDDTVIYLLPDASFGAAQKQGKAVDDALIVAPQTLRKRLSEDGYLAFREAGRPDHITVRRAVAGDMIDLLPMKKSFFVPPISSQQPDIPDSSGSPQSLQSAAAQNCPADTNPPDSSKPLNNNGVKRELSGMSGFPQDDTPIEKPFFEGGDTPRGDPPAQSADTRPTKPAQPIDQAAKRERLRI